MIDQKNTKINYFLQVDAPITFYIQFPLGPKEV